jgi:hypothetical protein
VLIHCGKKTYKNVVSLSSLQRDEPHLDAKRLKLSASSKRRKIDFGMHLDSGEGGSGQ